LIDVRVITEDLSVSFGTANKLVDNLSDLGLLRETTGRKRDRVFRFDPYLSLFEGDEDAPIEPREAEVTEF
jgi:hypothetical protein